jgi:hypothetical protein
MAMCPEALSDRWYKAHELIFCVAAAMPGLERLILVVKK